MSFLIGTGIGLALAAGLYFCKSDGKTAHSARTIFKRG